MTERISASQIGRQMACHASANLEVALPGYVHPVKDRTADNAANRGTSMHEVFAKVQELGNGDFAHMVRALQYVADIRATRRFKVLVEQEIKATWLTTQPETTVDLVLYTADEIHVIDLKTGRLKVDVLDNEQLIYYAICFAHLAPKAKGVMIHIVQPWADNMESQWISGAELWQHMREMQHAEEQILAGDVTFGPSKHCTFCSANPHSRGLKGNIMCPAMMQMLYPLGVDEDEMLGL
jgi:hypothetical protein